MKAIGKTVIALSLFVFIFSAATVAQQTPGLPHLFWGDANVDGEGLTGGSTIIAKVGGVEKGRVVTTAAGRYGGPSGSEGKLLVQGDIGDNAVIEFFIFLVKADQTANFDSGEIDNLNLTWAFPDVINVTGPVFNEPMLCMPGSHIDVEMEGLHLHITCEVQTAGNINNVSLIASPAASPSGLIRTTDAFEISVSGSGLSVVAVMDYDGTGVDEDSIVPFKFAGSWTPLPFNDIVSRDMAGNRIAFKINPETPYALFGSLPLPLAPVNITNATVIISPDNLVLLNVSGMLVNITSNDSAVTVINNLSNLGGGFVAGTPIPGSFVNISSTFEISVSGNVTVMVTIPYNDTGIDESTIVIYKFVGGSWIAIPSLDIVSINTAANTITFRASPGTPYTAFGSPPSAPTADAQAAGGGAAAGVSLSISAPGSITIQPGTSGNFDVIVRANNRTALSTAVTVSGLPSGFIHSVTPGSMNIPSNGTGTFTVTVSVPSGEAERTMTLTLTAKSGTTNVSRNIDLVVATAPPSALAPPSPTSTPTSTPPPAAPSPTSTVTGFVVANPAVTGVVAVVVLGIVYFIWRAWKGGRKKKPRKLKAEKKVRVKEG